VDPQAVVNAVCKALPRVQAIYLFGSVARGDDRRESDVDLAVLAPAALSPEARWELQERLAGLLHGPVDLVELRQASTVMRAQVLASARLPYTCSPQDTERFEVLALSAYARLNEERREILQDIRARGRVYA